MSFFIEKNEFLYRRDEISTTHEKKICCGLLLCWAVVVVESIHPTHYHPSPAENRFHVSFKVGLAKKKNDTGGRDFKGEEGKRIL